MWNVNFVIKKLWGAVCIKTNFLSMIKNAIDVYKTHVNIHFQIDVSHIKQRSWGHIVAIEHAKQLLNSLEDYMYIQASIMLQFNEMIVLSELLGFILKNFEQNESIIGT